MSEEQNNEEMIIELLDKAKKENVDSIKLSDKVKTFGIDNNFLNVSLTFNPQWYQENTALAHKMIVKLIQEYNDKTFTISDKELIKDDIISAIAQNKNIKEVNLARYNITKIYRLSKKHFELLKKSGKDKVEVYDVEDDLKEVFDPMLPCNMNKIMFGTTSYLDLQRDNIIIFKPISSEKLDNLKYINDNATITLNQGVNVDEILSTLEKYNKNNTVKIRVYDDSKNEVNKMLIKLGYLSKDGISKKIPSDKLHILYYNEETMPLKEYVNYENLLYSFVKDAQNLSPLEKYIYAYDIVKRFKEYNTPKKDNKNIDMLSYDEKFEIRQKSRNLYEILYNDYIVCSGFSNFLQDLLEKLDVPSIKHSVDVELSAHKASSQLRNKYSNWKDMNVEEKNKLIIEQQINIPHTDYEGHSRLMVSIKDDKYGVDGVYFSDATWDNSVINNDYSHILMTSDIIDSSTSKLKFSEKTSLFYTTTPSEFKDVFYVSIKKYIDNVKNIENKSSKNNAKKDIKIDLNHEIVTFLTDNYLKNIKVLFPNEYKQLLEIYPYIEKSYSDWPFKNEYYLGLNGNLDEKDIAKIINDISSLLNDLSILILSKNNNQVSRETLYNAIKEVYSEVYVGGLSEEQIKEMMEHTDKHEIMEYGEVKRR